MGEVQSTALDRDSRLQGRVEPGDFIDCYTVAAGLGPREAARVITDFPGWARWLLQVRRVITAPFGLSQDGPEAPDKIGPFPVEAETERELVAGFDDKHLDVRVSVWSEEGRVSLATWVRPHNIGGRLYLALIMPFHVAIAKDALRRVAASDAQGAIGS